MDPSIRDLLLKQSGLRKRICFEVLLVAGINHPFVEAMLKFCETFVFEEGFSLRGARSCFGLGYGSSIADRADEPTSICVYCCGRRYLLLYVPKQRPPDSLMNRTISLMIAVFSC
jgi:hypothetical protein